MDLVMNGVFVAVADKPSKDGSKVYHECLVLQGTDSLKSYVSDDCLAELVSCKPYHGYTFRCEYNPKYERLKIAGVLGDAK